MCRGYYGGIFVEEPEDDRRIQAPRHIDIQILNRVLPFVFES